MNGSFKYAHIFGFLMLTCLASKSYGGETAVSNIKDIIISLNKQKEALLQNSTLNVTESDWTINITDRGRWERAVQQFKMENQNSIAIDSISKSSEEIQDAIVKEMGAPDIIKWEMHFYKGVLKFRRTISMKSSPDHPNAISVNEIQWLYTDKQVYRYIPSEKQIDIKPLNPSVENYPITLDNLDIAFSVFKLDPALLASTAIGANSNQVLIQENSGNSMTKISFDKSDGEVFGQYVGYFVNNAPKLERYYGSRVTFDDQTLKQRPVISQLIMRTENDQIIVQLFVATKIQFGENSDGNIAINAIKGTRVFDELNSGSTIK